MLEPVLDIVQVGLPAYSLWYCTLFLSKLFLAIDQLKIDYFADVQSILKYGILILLK